MIIERVFKRYKGGSKFDALLGSNFLINGLRIWILHNLLQKMIYVKSKIAAADVIKRFSRIYFTLIQKE